jgi:hypothetical protein
MFTSTKARSELLKAMREYLSGKQGPLRIETLVTALAGVDWLSLDEKDRRIVDGMFRVCGWARGKWPHWLPIARPDAGSISPIAAATAEGAICDRWGGAIEPERAAA